MVRDCYRILRLLWDQPGNSSKFLSSWGCLQGRAELMLLQPSRLWTRSVAPRARWGLCPEHLTLKAPLPTSEPLEWTPVGVCRRAPQLTGSWRTLSLAPAPRLRTTWQLGCFVHHVTFPKHRLITQFKQECLYAWALTTLKEHKSSFTEDNKKLPPKQILCTLQFCFKECGVKEWVGTTTPEC